MKYIFGKSPAAVVLQQLISQDAYLQAKVSSHVNDYFHYVEEISKLQNRKVRIKALQCNLECNLEVSDEIKRFIRNVKMAKRRTALTIK
jgi:hypothetical protein